MQVKQEQLEELAERSACVVCLEASIKAVIMPCMHACVCDGCLGRLRRCPVCRAGINRAEKVFFAR